MPYEKMGKRKVRMGFRPHTALEQRHRGVSTGTLPYALVARVADKAEEEQHYATLKSFSTLLPWLWEMMEASEAQTDMSEFYFTKITWTEMWRVGLRSIAVASRRTS